MNGYGNSYSDEEQQRPLAYFRGYPLYAAYFVVAAICVAWVVSMFLKRYAVGALLAMGYDSSEVLAGEVWRVFTYSFVQVDTRVWFLLELYLLGYFGRELERLFGRRRFLFMYAGLCLLTPAVFTLLGLWYPYATMGRSHGLAVFVGFAALLPNAVMMFGILAKWMAIALVVFNSVVLFSDNNVPELVALWASVGFVYVYTRREQGQFTLPKFSLFQRKPKLRVLPDLKPDRADKPRVQKEDAMVEVDALLDKIARSGIGSLTPKERARLDEARENLKRRRE